MFLLDIEAGTLLLPKYVWYASLILLLTAAYFPFFFVGALKSMCLPMIDAIIISRAEGNQKGARVGNNS